MRKIARILALIVAILLIAFIAFRTFTKSKSPEAVAATTQNGLAIKVTYCQPAKNGRIIFGELVPYGQIWRTGANEATIIHFGQDVLIAGKPLAKGDYSLWTIPDRDSWVAIFNSETGQWGTNHDPSKDVLRVPMATRAHMPTAERFTIQFAPASNGTMLVMFWDKVEASLPIVKQ